MNLQLKERDRLRLKQALVQLFMEINQNTNMAEAAEAFQISVSDLAGLAQIELHYCAACEVAHVLSDMEFVNVAGSWVVTALDGGFLQFNRCSEVLLSFTSHKGKRKLQQNYVLNCLSPSQTFEFMSLKTA